MFKVIMTDCQRWENVDVEKGIVEKAGMQFVAEKCETEDDVIARCQDADILISAGIPITKKVFMGLPKCRAICRYGIGVDTVDIPAATEAGICIANVPDFCWDEVSDTAMSLLLAVTRKVVLLNNLVKKGIWNRLAARPVYRFRGQTLGIIAFGNIGRTLYKKAVPFGFKIIAYDPHIRKETIQDYDVELVSLDHLLKNSDIISIHAPLTQETRGLIGEAELKKMKPTAYIINTGRGPVINGKALYKALKEGWIAGAGLDVMEKEPPDPDDPLLTLDNIVITPHYASYTEEAYHELHVKVAENAVHMITHGYPKYWVNPEVKSKMRKF
jgi:D-3-phosphoglycerate dehydrogenase